MTKHLASSTEPDDAIVAVGLLTQTDLNLLGSGFRRAFRVDEHPLFDDLLAAIDRAEARRVSGT